MNCHIGTSITAALAGITIIEAKGSIEETAASILVGLLIIEIAIKNGIIINIIKGATPDWAS